MTSTLWHTKYRPQTLDKMIGHEQAVTRLKGIINNGNWPSAMLFTGAPAAGKTTLARAIAAQVNGKTIEEQQRQGLYKELDGGSQRSIEDVRDLVQLSRHKPMGGAKRIFVIDEAQSILTNKVAAQALLKPIEDSGTKDTIWILCSMDPGKFQSTTEGKAIAGRCVQFVLGPHTEIDRMKQAKRIVVGEELTFLKDNELLQRIVEGTSDMRGVASSIQAVADYYAGLDEKPKKLSMDTLIEALGSTEQDDDKLAAQIVSSALIGKFVPVQLAVLEIGDPFQVINKILWAAQFLLNLQVLDGKKSSKVIWMPSNRAALNGLKGQKISLGAYAAFLEMAVQLKTESMQFTVDAQSLISSKVYRFIKNQQPPAKG